MRSKSGQKVRFFKGKAHLRAFEKTAINNLIFGISDSKTNSFYIILYTRAPVRAK